MNRLPILLPLFGVALAGLATLAGCGDEGATCGAGTTEQDGTCVPTVTCGTGTVAMGGQCVPDGSVICEQGTTFDPSSGKCEVDPSACAEGTVLVEGECVPEDDTLTADRNEAAEPNDQSGAGMFDAPALNQSISIHGCVTPRGGAADEDPWIITATGPTLLEITADGVGGLAAGFIVQDLDLPGLANYIRFGINLAGDMSKRQVYLPAAGDYVLLMDDSRALLTGEAAGNAETCYYTSIKQVAMPAATAATLPQTTGMDSGNVRVISYAPDAAGDIFDINMTEDSEGLLPAFIVRKNGQLYASAAYDQTNDVPPFYTVGGLAPTDQIEIVVDNIYNFSLTPQAYAFQLFDIAANRLPTDGTAVTITKKNGTLPDTPWWENDFSYFDITTPGQVVHFNLVSSTAVNMRILRKDIFTPAGAFDAFVTIASGNTTRTDFSNQFVRFLQPGRYYFQTFDRAGTGGQTYTLTATLSNMMTPAVTYGTAMPAQALPAQGAAFYTLDLNNPTWIELGVPAVTNWGAAGINARVRIYDLAGEGWLDNGYAAVQTVTQPQANPVAGGRIMLGDMRDFLVRVDATGAVGTGPTFDLSIKDRPHVLLGTSAAGTPIVRMNMDTVAPGGALRYLVFGTAGNLFNAVATPTVGSVNINISRRNADESANGAVINGAGAGAAETLTGGFVASPNWVAFQVNNLENANGSNVDLTFTSVTPRPYTASTGTLAFVDACTGTGSSVLPAPLAGAGDDEFSAVQTLPMGFNFAFFGEPVTQFVIAANGILSFGATNPACSGAGCFSNAAIPGAAQPNGFIAGYWDDLEAIRVCRKDEAGKVTIQWTGNVYASGTAVGEAVDFQVVLNASGNIDFIYGPNHVASGGAATVGAENSVGGLGNQLVFNQAGMVLPNTSRTLTPQ